MDIAPTTAQHSGSSTKASEVFRLLMQDLEGIEEVFAVDRETSAAGRCRGGFSHMTDEAAGKSILALFESTRSAMHALSSNESAFEELILETATTYNVIKPLRNVPYVLLIVLKKGKANIGLLRQILRTMEGVSR